MTPLPRGHFGTHVQSLLAAQRRTTYEIAELEEAQAEAAELWHSGALRQLRQLERALKCAAGELQNEAGSIRFLGVTAGPRLTLYSATLLLGGLGAGTDANRPELNQLFVDLYFTIIITTVTACWTYYV